MQNDDTLAGYQPIGITFAHTWGDKGFIPDLSTKNKSFLRCCKIFQMMGVKNYLWPLALRDRGLAKVDPWDPNLSIETKVRIAIECKVNFIYFFREVVRIPSAGGETIPFIANRANLAMLFCFALSTAMGITIPRQQGKTITMSAIMAYLMYILADNISIGMFTKDSALVQDNTTRLKEIRTDGIPKWMISTSSKDTDNKEGVSYAAKGNFYKTFVAAGDERSASKLGRGSTLACEVFDEFAYFKYNHITIPTAIMAMNSAAPSVRKRGIPATVIYASTAGNPDTPEGMYALRTLSGAMEFTEQIYDIPDYPTFIEILDKSSVNRIVYIEYSYKQLGKSDEWFRQVAAQSNGSPEDIARDLLNEWRSSSNNGVIPPEVRETIRKSQSDPLWVDTSHGFWMRWYVDEATVKSEEFRKKPLVAGMDTSENVGRDFTTLVILDPTDMSLIAACRCNDSNTMQIARYMTDILLVYKKMVWIPERNNTGIALIDFVMEQLQESGINPYTRIYNECIQNREDPRYKDIDIYDYRNIYGSTRSAFGYRTTGGAVAGTSRNMLYKNIMMKTVHLNATRIKDSILISELCNLTVRNGRIDHRTGMHDDTVIAYLLACFFIMYGRNLRMYGIPDGVVLSSITTDGKSIDKQSRDEQLAIRSRIDELEGLLTNTKSHMLKASYLRELNSLKPLVKDSIDRATPIAIAQVAHEKQVLQEKINPANSKAKAYTNQLAQAFRNTNRPSPLRTRTIRYM